MSPSTKCLSNQSCDLFPHQYDDSVLFGARQIPELPDTNCVIYGSFADKQKWTIKNLINHDRRVERMLKDLNVHHAVPVQRFTWPQLRRAFPFACISPKATGKTSAYLLYIIAQHLSCDINSNTTTARKKITNETKHLNIDPSISEIDQTTFDFNSLGLESDSNKEELDPLEPDEFILHPKYFIICSSQQHVETVLKQIQLIKATFLGREKNEDLEPIARSVDLHKSEDKLAVRCSESEILIGTPKAFIRCLDLEYITFAKCEKVILDDLDVTLQLHNWDLREIIKKYVKTEETSCQICAFSRKLTNLVRHFLNFISSQTTIIFCSILEAAMYVRIRFELEIFASDHKRLAKLYELIKQCPANTFTAIVCRDEKESYLVFKVMENMGHKISLLRRNDGEFSSTASIKNVCVLSDASLDLELDHLNSVTHLIHYSLPDELITFDLRFRLMYKLIKDSSKSLKSTIFMMQGEVKLGKELLDMFSRSEATHKSTKLLLRDHVSENSSTICWRWASTGLCRLEKLSRDDQFGSYCPDRHTIKAKTKKSRWPQGGQFKISMVRVISPNEFYFRFEEHRDSSSEMGAWKKFEQSGYSYMNEIQKKLNILRNTEKNSLELSEFKEGKIFGVYLQQEARVERIKILRAPSIDESLMKPENKKDRIYIRDVKLEYETKQCEVLRVDHGEKTNVYLKNMFKLPEDLASMEPLCHRGFHIGVKPTENEPFWNYKAINYFKDKVFASGVVAITAWLRLQSDGYFWFENMHTHQKLVSIDDDRLLSFQVHSMLARKELADETDEPSFLNPSEYSEAYCKWRTNEAAKFAQYAFLRKDKGLANIFVLHINSEDLGLTVRQSDYNKQLIQLENEMMDQFLAGKLESLSYRDMGVYCLAKIIDDPECTINRCKIIKWEGDMYTVRCLDHGDDMIVKSEDLFLAPANFISRLPFQAIKSKLADLNLDLPKRETVELLYQNTRDKNDQLLPMICRFNNVGDLYIYRPVSDGLYAPLLGLMEKEHNIKLSTDDDPKLREAEMCGVFEDVSETVPNLMFVRTVEMILEDIIEEELKASVTAQG